MKIDGETPQGETTQGETPQGKTPSSSKEVVKHINENRFYGFTNNFIPIEKQKEIGKDNSVSQNEKFVKFFKNEEDIFYCESSDNQVNGKYCFKENEFCPSCMKINQQYHKLKSNYLINAAGRVCTYRKGKMFCLGKFQRVNKVEKIIGKGNESNIVYFLDLTCNGKVQCKPCEEIQKNMDKYYSSKMIEQLKKRDEKLGY